ncbi:putative sulfate exporter family transporter [Desulfovibrio litoralis]|uniref:Uncharacterized membrane protein YadS n=1 Tax=Desulfovibrio litoralis DSM 11393 TaxID=1121455 RepID=A0A1M7RUB4_9BACT|nr:putative sulfate exporter family transporter [Desulfovibrio litoralis]SHN49851.1 Uncharacterized membrane protein YadS [Desulfovibrio litoralis DSM 11393]
MGTKKVVFNEDRVALLVGSFLFVMALLQMFGIDTLGWVVKTNIWTSPEMIFSASTYTNLNGIVALFVTYLGLMAILGTGIKLLNGDLKNFFFSFTVVFFVSYLCYAIGSYAYIAATPDQLEKYNIAWGMSLTGEAGFIIALVTGVLVGNLMPNASTTLREVCRPEMFVKIAIVVMGAELGVKAADGIGLASSIIALGLCAIVAAYLIYWAVVYYIARKYFKFSREWAAPLASGISICGVSAAIATGGAIRARPIVPIMVSSLVVVFTCIEMLILPFIAQQFLYHEPLVAGGWMGLVVKSDGGAMAAGAITEALIRAKAISSLGVNFEPGWVVMVTTTVKIFIDVFIGVWAFVLAYIWCTKFDPSVADGRMKFSAIWERFPRFVFGYVITFAVLLFISTQIEGGHANAKAMVKPLNSLRLIFFTLTFFTIGLVSNFKKLMEEGIAKLAIVYVICLFGFIIWVGLAISWIFFSGILPPVVS